MAKRAPRTYAEITQEIDSLQQEAQAVLKAELAGVIERINEAIAFYGLQPGDLKFPKSAGNVKSKGRGGRKASAASAGKPSSRGKKAAPVVKYGDGTGNTWSGRGPRPRWLREALADGSRELSSFAV